MIFPAWIRYVLRLHKLKWIKNECFQYVRLQVFKAVKIGSVLPGNSTMCYQWWLPKFCRILLLLSSGKKFEARRFLRNVGNHVRWNAVSRELLTTVQSGPRLTYYKALSVLKYFAIHPANKRIQGMSPSQKLSCHLCVLIYFHSIHV